MRISNFKFQVSNYFKGQALVMLLTFTVIAVTVTTAAVAIVIENSKSGDRLNQGVVAGQIAKSGVEDALIRILRDPAYVGENGLVIGEGSADISVTGAGTVADPYIIISEGKLNSHVKKIQVEATYINDELEVVSEKEVY